MFAAGALGFFFGAGGTLAYFEYYNKRSISPRAAPTPAAQVQGTPAHPQGTVDAVAMKNYRDLGKYGYPSADTVFVKQGFVSSFDPMLRIPRWVMELITPASVSAKTATRDHSKFYSNDSIAEAFRATNADYSSIKGISRGHLAPAQFHKDSQTAMDSTFDLSLNAVPQDMASNASDWMRVENLCKKLTKDFAALYVVTGPLFVPKTVPGKRPNDPPRTVVEYDVIGSHAVAMPTHLFKSILAEAHDGTTAIATFVVPNAPLNEERPLTSFLVPKEQVEKWSGLQLFPIATDSAKAPQMARPYELCAKHNCEASAGGFGVTYRQVAKLRNATSPAALDAAWREVTAAKANEKIDGIVAKEYESQKAAFGIK